MNYRFEQRSQQTEKTCDHPDCILEGQFRAPKNRINPDADFLWFCLEHIRAYNKSWNYFDGMTGDEIEDWQHKANIWHRPTWSTKDGRLKQFTADSIRDDFDIFNSTGFDFGDMGSNQSGPRRPTRDSNGNRLNGLRPEHHAALAELNLAWPVDRDTVRKCYKALAKKLHPDMTGGDTVSNERMKRINQAYALLMGRSAEGRNQSPI